MIGKRVRDARKSLNLRQSEVIWRERYAAALRNICLKHSYLSSNLYEGPQEP